jgi:hypothetical protein
MNIKIATACVAGIAMTSFFSWPGGAPTGGLTL